VKVEDDVDYGEAALNRVVDKSWNRKMKIKADLP
jgi:hypothetical protein